MSSGSRGAEFLVKSCLDVDQLPTACIDSSSGSHWVMILQQWKALRGVELAL